MCAQLDFKVMYKRPKEEGRLPNFMNFGVKKFTIKKISKKELVISSNIHTLNLFFKKAQGIFGDNK
jgi:hypothetical protein